MDCEEFGTVLKEYMSSPETGCPWLPPLLSPPTSSSVAFAWPSPRLHQPLGKDENLENINHLFNLFDMKGDGLMSINDFNVCMLIWGVQNAEFDTHGKKTLNLSEFMDILSSFSFNVGEPLYDIALYRLFNHHPRKEALHQAHTHKLLAKFRKNHWGKVKKLINEKKMKDYWMVFSLFDMDGDGRLTTCDFETLMHIWGLSPMDAADMLDKFDELENGTIDFWGFLTLVDLLDIQIGEPLYHFAVFSLIDYHLQVAFMPEAELLNFSAIIRRNFCGREECLSMEYNLRSSKFVFSLVDVDYDGNITQNDYHLLKRIWGLLDSPLDAQEEFIDFESFLQVFPSINLYAVDNPKLALNLLDFHASNGLLPPKAISHVCEVLQEKGSKEAKEELFKHHIRVTFEMNRLFSLLDYDEDDHLTTKEVELLVCACKQLPEDEIKGILHKVDLSWGGRINFQDLLVLLKPFTLNPFRMIESPSELFKFMDRNEDGFLSASDFNRFALITGHQVSDEDIQGLMLKLDREGNGVVGRDHFCGAMQEYDFMPNNLDLDMNKILSQGGNFKIYRLFSFLDYDEDDHLTTKEVELLVCACKLPEDEIKGILHKVDLIWGGRINFQDLFVLLKPFTLNPFRIIESPSEFFKFLDRNEDGFLSASDFKRLALLTGDQVSDKDIHKFMLELGIEGNGEVGRDHFCGVMQQEYDFMPNNLELDINKMSISNHDTTEEVADYQTKEIEFTSFWELDANVEEVHDHKYNSTESEWMSFSSEDEFDSQ